MTRFYKKLQRLFVSEVFGIIIRCHIDLRIKIIVAQKDGFLIWRINSNLVTFKTELFIFTSIYIYKDLLQTLVFVGFFDFCNRTVSMSDAVF